MSWAVRKTHLMLRTLSCSHASTMQQHGTCCLGIVISCSHHLPDNATKLGTLLTLIPKASNLEFGMDSIKSERVCQTMARRCDQRYWQGHETQSYDSDSEDDRDP